MYYNLDKALIPFILASCLPGLFVARKHPSVGKAGWIALVFAIPALLFLAVALGGLKIELHAPAWIGTFVIGNLFFVCLVEEAFFRCYLQQRLSQWLGALPALIIASLLFGAAHFPGAAIDGLCRDGRSDLWSSLDVEWPSVGSGSLPFCLKFSPPTVLYLPASTAAIM